MGLAVKVAAGVCNRKGLFRTSKFWKIDISKVSVGQGDRENKKREDGKEIFFIGL